MTISKLDQLERDYARVAKKHPHLIPVTWSAPKLLDDDPETLKALIARLKDAYRHRKRRAKTRAMAVVETTTELVGNFTPTPVSRGTPKATTEGLPRGWRWRELRGNRKAPSSSESMRKLETSNQRARLRITW